MILVGTDRATAREWHPERREVVGADIESFDAHGHRTPLRDTSNVSLRSEAEVPIGLYGG